VARLSSELLRSALDAIAEIGGAEDLDAFRASVIEEIARVVPGNYVAYNEVDVGRGMVFAYSDPPPDEALLAAFHDHVHEHPVIAAHADGQAERALAISDLMDAEAFEATGLYRNVYAPMDIRDQLAVQFSPPGDVIVSMAICRPQRGFTEGEHKILELLRPHLTNAYVSARTRGLGERIRGFLEAAIAGGAGVAVIGASGRITETDETGRRLLATLGWGHDGDPAPQSLVRWLGKRRRAHGPAQLQLEGTGGTVAIEGAFDQPAGGEALLLLRALDRGPEAGPPLTPRERQVLELVAEGLSDDQIARRLRISSGTVRKHLEHVRSKLGVPTRAAAVARGLGRPSPEFRPDP
jgi:DNA-binding CsgD family transcriptional regulator